jgi:hypothetical protein
VPTARWQHRTGFGTPLTFFKNTAYTYFIVFALSMEIFMGQSTIPDGIQYPSDVDRLTPVTFGPLQNIFEDMANSIQTAMNNIGQGAVPLEWTVIFNGVDLGDDGDSFGAAYRIGDLVYITGGFALGADSVIDNDVTVELPLAGPLTAPIGLSATYFDANSGDIYELGLLSNGSDAAFVVKDTDTHNYVSLAPLNATVPVAFDDGSFVTFSALYVETPLPLV